MTNTRVRIKITDDVEWLTRIWNRKWAQKYAGRSDLTAIIGVTSDRPDWAQSVKNNDGMMLPTSFPPKVFHILDGIE